MMTFVMYYSQANIIKHGKDIDFECIPSAKIKCRKTISRKKVKIQIFVAFSLDQHQQAEE